MKLKIEAVASSGRFASLMTRAVSLACLLCAATLTRAASASDIELQGVINGSQNMGYMLVPFQVPAGTARLTVSFSYTGKEEKTTIDLGVQDPERFRGWSGGNKSDFTIGIADATPSYLPGPLPAGEWKLTLGIAHIRPGHTAKYVARVHLTPVGAAQAESFTTVPLESHARWYRGDLHLHTTHSDGSCASQSGKSVPCPLFVSVEEAAHHGLDFLAVTDHNTTSTYDEERELQPYFDKLLLIPGRELTTYSGHANVWGTTEFIDFRAGGPNLRSKDDMLAQARALGALVSINHPIGPDAEHCIGCAWNEVNADNTKIAAGEQATDMHLVSAIEVINGPAGGASGYFHASDIEFWEAQLRRGFHITAVGGSDTHRPDLDTIGLPTTVVYARDLSVAAILDGIRAGHVFVDLTGSRNLPEAQPRTIELKAGSGTMLAMVGDTLAVTPDTPFVITIRVTSSLGSVIRVLIDGKPDPTFPSSTIVSEDQTFSSRWLPQLALGKPHWLRAEVHAPDGSLQLLTNPIYLTPQTSLTARPGR